MIQDNRCRIIGHAGDIWTISRKKALCNVCVVQSDTAGTLFVAHSIYAAQFGFFIKIPARDVRVVNSPFEIYLFIATAAALTAETFPFPNVLIS